GVFAVVRALDAQLAVIGRERGEPRTPGGGRNFNNCILRCMDTGGRRRRAQGLDPFREKQETQRGGVKWTVALPIHARSSRLRRTQRRQQSRRRLRARPPSKARRHPRRLSIKSSMWPVASAGVRSFSISRGSSAPIVLKSTC